MGDVSVVDRIRGVRIETGANRPFPMDDPERVHFVERGYLDVFAVEWRRHEAVGRRRFVARVPAGEMAFGACPVASPGDSRLAFVCLAVPSRGAVIIEGERAGVESSFDLTATYWIDQWIASLSDFLARELPPPRDALPLEADPDVPYAAGSLLTAQHRDVVWASAKAPVRLLGRADLVVAEGEHPLPVTERTWFTIDEDTLVSAVFTPTAHATERLWPAFDRFGATVLDVARLAQADEADTVQLRRRQTWEAQRSTVAAALQGFSRILNPRSRRADPAPTGRTPLQEAVSLVAESCGVRLEIPSGSEKDAARWTETVEELAGRSRLRTRRVRLTSDWWRRAGPPLLGFRRGTKHVEPVALLSDDRGRYRAVDPANDAAFDVDRTTADRIAPEAVLLYPPLPVGVKTGTDVIRFSLHKRGPDVCAMLGAGVMGGLAALATPILTGQVLVEII
ncbi:MAG: hypothetical protein OXG44_01685, partial [Gammaproteobacteria bacterium]|nr:hypothetical protein [Gammaproteobacteria bacterium]